MRPTFRWIVLFSVCLTIAVTTGDAVAQAVRQVPLRNVRADVVVAYARLASAGPAQRAMYVALPAQMKEDIWALHIEYFLTDHPELTAEQRSVCLEGLGIVESGALETDRFSAEWNANVGQALQRLEVRIKTFMPGALGREAFAQLGPATPSIVSSPAERPGIRGKLQRGVDSAPIPDCECSTISEGYECSNCVYVADSCTFRIGCGPFYEYACNGLCNG